MKKIIQILILISVFSCNTEKDSIKYGEKIGGIKSVVIGLNKIKIGEHIFDMTEDDRNFFIVASSYIKTNNFNVGRIKKNTAGLGDFNVDDDFANCGHCGVIAGGIEIYDDPRKDSIWIRGIFPDSNQRIYPGLIK